MDINTILDKLYQSKDLTTDESYFLFDNVIKGKLDPILLAAALTALKIKGESIEEITGAASALIGNSASFPSPSYDFADIVGTGGDGHNTINISTTAAFVAASCGAKIAKHGNRGVSSKSGSSDLLTALGVKIDMSEEQARKALDDINICFLFAPKYHSGVRHAVPVRQVMKTRTIFNLLGPLVNPAKPTIELMGIYDPNLILPIAKTMVSLGIKRAAIVHGSGLDEVAIHGTTKVAEINNGHIEQYTLSPQDFGLEKQPISAIKGGTPEENAIITKAILQGKGTKAHSAAVAANVALLLKLFGEDNIKENAQKSLDIMASSLPYSLVESLASYG